MPPTAVGRRRWPIALLLAGVALVALAFGAGVHGGPAMGSSIATPAYHEPPQRPSAPASPTELATPLGLPKQDDRPATALGIILGIVAVALGLLLLFLIAHVARAVVRALRRQQRPPAPSAEIGADVVPGVVPDGLVEEVHDTFTSAAQRLDNGEDVDAAIIECWRRLEDVASRSGLPRRPSDTPTDYTTRLLESTAVDANDLGRLRTLYQRAMFSTARATEADRRTAIDALVQLGNALDRARDARP